MLIIECQTYFCYYGFHLRLRSCEQKDIYGVKQNVKDIKTSEAFGRNSDTNNF